jgi:hypothetical protein
VERGLLQLKAEGKIGFRGSKLDAVERKRPGMAAEDEAPNLMPLIGLLTLFLEIHNIVMGYL